MRIWLMLVALMPSMGIPVFVLVLVVLVLVRGGGR